MRRVTLLFLVDETKGEILLAMKKHGFGTGKYNGTGGKVEEGEDIEDAVVREAREEVGVAVEKHALTKCALLHFSFDTKPGWGFECHTYLAFSWIGEPAESEEMAPRWFALKDIPYDRMWIDDRLWLPRVLAGERLEGRFHFNSDGSAILRQDIQELRA
jgi:8-oxo-dGTP pyrophosphatase MutT (NUDIX family)